MPVLIRKFEKKLYFEQGKCMDIKTLVPKNKFDNSTVNELSQLTDEQIKPIILDLLKWLQDYNCPIAQELLPIIIKHQNVTVPYISDILNGDDVMWKYWIMELFIPSVTETNKKFFISDIKKLTELKEIDEDTIIIIEAAVNCLKHL